MGVTGVSAQPHTVFDEAIAARPLGPGRFAVQPDERFTFGGAVNGGVLIASILRAVLYGSPHPYPVATSAHFLRVAQLKPAEVHVVWLREGRTAATARATLVQDGVAVIETIVTTGTLAGARARGGSGTRTPDGGDDRRPDPGDPGDAAADAPAALSWTGEPPHLPPVGECRSFPPRDGFTGQVAIRFDPATIGGLGGQPNGTPEMRGYLSLREERDPDAYLLALAVDALPPAVLALGAVGWAPTVELTWHMRNVPAPGLLRVAARCRHVSGGWFDEEAEVWDAAGHLVAQSRQIARVGRRMRVG